MSADYLLDYRVSLIEELDFLTLAKWADLATRASVAGDVPGAWGLIRDRVIAGAMAELNEDRMGADYNA